MCGEMAGVPDLRTNRRFFMSFNVNDLIGLTEKAARKLAVKAGFTLIQEVTNCSHKKDRIQVKLDDKGLVATAKIG